MKSEDNQFVKCNVLNAAQSQEIIALKEQIKRLIEAGDEMRKYIGITHDSDKWNEAKEETKQ